MCVRGPQEFLTVVLMLCSTIIAVVYHIQDQEDQRKTLLLRDYIGMEQNNIEGLRTRVHGLTLNYNSPNCTLTECNKN